MSNVAKLKKRALDYEQKKQFDKALETYMQVLGALGDHVEEADVALFNRVGDLLLRQGNVASAVDHYERAVDLYTEGGFHNNAIALCSKILRNAPGRSSIYYKLGKISAKKGFTSDAKVNFLEYADRMQRIGQVEEAFRALKEFADLCPDQDEIRLMLADQLVRADRKAEAIEQLQLHLERLEAEGRTQEAKATIERMRAIDPSHQPRPGVSRPTPKANDLIFLDVNYDGPVGAKPAPGAARPEVVAPQSLSTSGARAEEQLPHLATESTLPMPGAESAESIQISPVDGLSSGASFGDDADSTGAASTNGLMSQMDPQLLTGFEETSLGGIDQGHADIQPLSGLEQSSADIAPIAGIEHSSPVVLDMDGMLELADEPGGPPSLDQSEELTPAIAHDAADDDGLQLLDISLDIIDESTEPTGGELTFIFPGDDPGGEWSADPAAEDARGGVTSDAAGSVEADMEPTGGSEWSGLAADDLHLEPLLQLPEIHPEAELVGMLSQDLPLIARADPGMETGLEESEMATDDSPSTGPELQFLSLGNEGDEHDSAAGTEITGFEYLEIGASRDDVSVELAGQLDSLRTSTERDPSDWESRRRLAEALLEEGDRAGGLAELEAAMLGFEHAGDVRSAKAILDEMIRVQPLEVRYHQKRVEYAVHSNDRALLADAYFALAESLFQMGELDKSRAVYSRVLELSPGDPRVRAALGPIISGGTIGDIAEARPAPQPPTNGATPAPAATAAPEPLTPTETPAPKPAAALADTASAPASPGVVTPEAVVAVPRPREPESATASRNFVNLADWLSEDEPTRNTRMVVDVKEPEIQEQVDFREMLAMFKQGVAANVDAADHEAHYDLGVAYKEMGLLDEAISEFQKALRGTEHRARTYEALGQCFVEKGQHQIAVTILSRALGDKSNTDDMLVGVLYLLGFASETLGRWADAQRFYERVFAVDIEFRDIGERLAVAERGGK